MHYKFLCRFLLDIGKPLGGGNDENLWDVGKKASSFKLQWYLICIILVITSDIFSIIS